MQKLELSTSDYSQLGTLQEFLRHTAPGMEITRSSGRLAPGEQGALDLLTVAADSTVLTAALNLIPKFLESRRPGTKVIAKGRKKEIEIDGTLSDEQVKRIIDWFLDE